VDALERRYLELALRFGTRPKFLQWHQAGFERMRRRLEAGDSAEIDLPTATPMG
jgi:hypothetical protein